MRIVFDKTTKNSLQDSKLLLKRQQRFKVKGIVFLVKKLIRLLQASMIIKECNQLIRQKHEYGTDKDQGSEKKRLNVITKSNNA